MYTERSDSDGVDANFTNTTPLAPNASVTNPSVGAGCSGCDQNFEQDDFTATVTGSITNCPQGCTYSWSVSGGASASCPGGSVARGGSANPSCSISANLDAQEGVSGSVSLTARNSVNPSAQDSDATGYDFFNRMARFQNCSSQTFFVPIELSRPAFSERVITPPLTHGERYSDTVTLGPTDACAGARHDAVLSVQCNDGALDVITSLGSCRL